MPPCGMLLSWTMPGCSTPRSPRASASSPDESKEPQGATMIEPSRELRDVCAVVGAGHSRLDQVPGVSSLDLLVEAARNAIADAGIDVHEIDGIICRGPDESYSHHQLVGERLGINARFSTSLDNGGASQILAVAMATMAIKAGLATTVICGY